MNKHTYQQFVEKSKVLHGDKYDYSKFIYKNSRTEGILICLTHNVEFLQTPQHHLRGCGCRLCSIQNYRSQKYTTENFIKQCNEIHGDKYDYSLVAYKDNKSKVNIICKKHGIFEQTPNSHLNCKCGCNMCNFSRGELEIEKFLIDKKIKHEAQKKFNNCIGKIKPLPFDFYLPEYNICVEYDGKQHVVGWWQYENNKDKNLTYLTKIKTNDKIKTKFCEFNQIKLIRIPHTDFKNIKAILEKEIFE